MHQAKRNNHAKSGCSVHMKVRVYVFEQVCRASGQNQGILTYFT
jgi:hypothetical protein